MNGLMISDLDFIESNSRSDSILGAGIIALPISTALATDLDTTFFTAFAVAPTPAGASVLRVAIASGAGAAAAATSVGGRATAVAVAKA